MASEIRILDLDTAGKTRRTPHSNRNRTINRTILHSRFGGIVESAGSSRRRQVQMHSTPAAAAIAGSRVMRGRSSATEVAAIKRSPRSAIV